MSFRAVLAQVTCVLAPALLTRAAVAQGRLKVAAVPPTKANGATEGTAAFASAALSRDGVAGKATL